MELTTAQLRHVFYRIISEDADFAKQMAKFAIEDALSVQADASLDMTEEELLTHGKPTVENIKGIAYDIYADQLEFLSKNIKKQIDEMSVAFKAELVVEIKDIQIS